MLLIRDEENIPKKLVRLLENREAYKYNLKINKKIQSSMPAIFWNTIIRYYNKVDFEELKDDKIIYVLEKIDGENTGV